MSSPDDLISQLDLLYSGLQPVPALSDAPDAYDADNDGQGNSPGSGAQSKYPHEVNRFAPAVMPVPAFDMKATLDKYFSNLPDGFSTIAPAALKDQMAATKVFILDVREAKEVADNGYIEGAINIPVRMFIRNLDKLPAKDQPIVVTCASGHRSALGMEALQLLGYTNVKSLAGGFGAWKAANLPISK